MTALRPPYPPNQGRRGRGTDFVVATHTSKPTPAVSFIITALPSQRCRIACVPHHHSQEERLRTELAARHPKQSFDTGPPKA
jgi:hypothetical protein